MRVVILVPDAAYPEPWAWAYDVEARALSDAGLPVEARAWTDPGEIGPADLVLPLVAWGYNLDYPRWLALLDRAEAEHWRMRNPPGLLRWNGDKIYLAELSDSGVPTVETLAVDSLDDAQLEDARDRFNSPRLIIKPPISGSAHCTFRLDPGEPVPEAATGRRMLIQPYQPSIETAGEWSLMLFGGEFSHAIVKRPRAGDFRVQPHLGGREEPCEPPPGAIDLARRALAAAPEPATYARVDMIRGEDGVLRIMELELIEPALFLHHDAGAPGRFARAIQDARASG